MELIHELKQRYKNLDILSQFIAVMTLCFVLPFILNTFLFLFNLKNLSVVDFFDISPLLSELLYKPWSLITYGFFHADLWHLISNMIIFYFSGRVVLDLFGKDKFVKIFIIGLLSGSITYVLSYNIFPVFTGLKPSMIGASAGVMAVFIFLASYNPNYTFRLIVFDIKIIYLALILIAMDLIQIPIGNSGGHLAHLGGAAWGYYYCVQVKQGNDTGQWVIRFMEYLKELSFKKRNVKKFYKRKNYKSSPKTSVDQQKIDLILDKISVSGYDSLTKSEKNILFKAGKN